MKPIWCGVPGDSAYQEFLKEVNAKVGAFLSLATTAGPVISGSLEGIPVGVKDNIAAIGLPLTCASKMLETLVSPYDATVVAKLKMAGAVVVGKTNLDEFGMGSSTQDSALGETVNPWDSDRVPGGSSGGSAAAVAAGMVPLAVGTDTGGSVRQPAMFCGVYGYKPTYGLISRFGLTAYASSLETPGFLTRKVSLLRTAMDVTAGIDDLDQTSTSDLAAEECAIEKLAVLKVSEGLSPEMAEAYAEAVQRWKNMGFSMVEVEIPELEFAVPAYYTIATAEASANLARFNGIRFGLRPEYAENPEELICRARTQGFGNEVKMRILLGTYVLRSGFQDQYYHRAQKVRTQIRRGFDRVFEQAPALLMPVFPTQAFLRGEAGLSHLQQKLADKFTVGANLTGYPALAMPSGIKNGLPVGFQVMAPALYDRNLFALAEKWENNQPVLVPDLYPARWES